MSDLNTVIWGKNEELELQVLAMEKSFENMLNDEQRKKYAELKDIKEYQKSNEIYDIVAFFVEKLNGLKY